MWPFYSFLCGPPFYLRLPSSKSTALFHAFPITHYSQIFSTSIFIDKQLLIDLIIYHCLLLGQSVSQEKKEDRQERERKMMPDTDVDVDDDDDDDDHPAGDCRLTVRYQCLECSLQSTFFL